jgi:hypothetical protein
MRRWTDSTGPEDDCRLRRVSFAIPLLIVSSLLGSSLLGCGPTYYDFTYEPNQLEAPARSEFKIAVIPFVDARETYDRGSRLWAWLPLVPYATERTDSAQDPRQREPGTYYFPEIVAYSIALDLAQNGIGSRVDLAPPALEDYDLIIHGKLFSTEKAERKLSYCLGPLGFMTSWVGAPQGQRLVTFQATYVAYDARGNTRIERPIRETWSSAYMGRDSGNPHMHGFVTTIRDANKAFLEELLQVMRQPPFQPEPEAIDERIRQYHQRLDPELAELIKERDQALGREGQLYRDFAALLQREIKKRARYLEAYRRTEDRIIGEQQDFVWATQHQRLIETAKVRAAQRTLKERKEQMEGEQFHATMRPLAGALVAGVMPAYGSAAGSGHWGDQQWTDLTQDLSAALAAMPPPPPPPPDLTPVLSKLEIETGGIDAPGVLLAGVKGNNIPEIRRNFLDLYRRKTRSIEQLKIDFMRRQQP